MTIDIILGAQWGDEGVGPRFEPNTTRHPKTNDTKGKLVDIQSRDAQLVCRAASKGGWGLLQVKNGPASKLWKAIDL
ncbi:unnamed protein product [Clonostachys byssicola]|uniref:Adenylosuccinate synthetase n=1 Tax=Clonostachys byssicola TaxID=160290 RepID=A0A9N9TZJ9_9HYPO|nr:unnamed protein product [Clonostachys byssicola]